MFLAAPLLMAYLCTERGRAKSALWFAAGLAPLAAVWGAYNWLRFGSIVESGYLRDPVVGLGGSIWSGASGLLFSSYASLFLYCPIALLSILGFAALWRRDRAAAALLGLLFVSFFLLYASLGNWMAGRAYGPRYLVPLMPALVLPLAWWRPVTSRGRVAAAVIVTLSVLVQLPGVLVDYSKVRVARARAGETVAQDMRWSRAPLLLNARAAAEELPPALASLAGLRPIDRVPPDVSNLNDALAGRPDLWWNSLLCLGVIGRVTAAAIAISLLTLGLFALARGYALSALSDARAMTWGRA
jgi:hypothetical protein